MSVPFNHIPSTLRLPLFWAEVDGSQAGTFQNYARILMLGHPLAGGTAPADVPVMVGTADKAKAMVTRGSQLDRMVTVGRLNNSFDEMWIVPIAEPSAGVAAHGTIVVSGPATNAGTLALYIAGQKLQIGITTGDSAATIAGKINTAINASPDLPVTSTVSTATVTVTCRWKGLTGNDIDMRANYFGSLGGEAYPSGVSLAFTAFSGGTGVPDLTAALANLGDREFDTIIMPWTDTATLNALDTFMQDGDGGRWAWDRQIYGHVYSAVSGTPAGLSTFGNARNGQHQTTWGYNGSPTPLWERAAAWGAQCHRALLNDPARPQHTLPLLGILPATQDLWMTKGEKNALQYDGVSVAKEMPDNTLQIETNITHYQVNPSGIADNAYLDVTTLFTLAYVLRSMRFRIVQKYPRHKLADNGTQFAIGQAIVTPNIARAELIAHYMELELLGLVENVMAFKKYLIVERNHTDPNRLDVLYPPDLVNQLKVFAVLNQFRLQYPPVTTDQSVPLISAA
jgi:phage tail sheath gpL-like